MPHPVVMGLALDADGKCVPMPAAGHIIREQPVREAVDLRAGEPAPLAFPNGQVGVWFDPERDGGDLLVSRESCLVTSLRLPRREGEVVQAFYLGLFRVERLSASQVRAMRPLRLDPLEHTVRVGAMQIELIAAQRAKPLSLEHELPTAAELFGAPAFVDPVCAALTDWVGRTLTEVAGKGFPRRLTRALACSGAAKDIDLFGRLVVRRPTFAGWVWDDVLVIERRFGRARVAPLASVLLLDWAGRGALRWLVGFRPST